MCCFKSGTNMSKDIFYRVQWKKKNWSQIRSVHNISIEVGQSGSGNRNKRGTRLEFPERNLPSVWQLIDSTSFKTKSKIQPERSTWATFTAQPSVSTADGYMWWTHRWSAAVGAHSVCNVAALDQEVFSLAEAWVRATGRKQCMCLKTDSTYKTITFFNWTLAGWSKGRRHTSTLLEFKNRTFEKPEMWTSRSSGKWKQKKIKNLLQKQQRFLHPKIIITTVIV